MWSEKLDPVIVLQKDVKHDKEGEPTRISLFFCCRMLVTLAVSKILSGIQQRINFFTNESFTDRWKTPIALCYRINKR